MHVKMVDGSPGFARLSILLGDRLLIMKLFVIGDKAMRGIERSLRLLRWDAKSPAR